MLQRIERRLVSNELASGLLFNRVTGAIGEYVEAARRRGRYARYRRTYDIDPTFEFLGPGTLLYGPGDVEFGADSYIGRHSRVQAKEGLAVRIGENTAVSYYVHIFTENRVADQDMSRVRNRSGNLETNRGDVVVGDHCWIGAMTFLSEGSTIGDNAVVGANSVVTDDLPPGSISVGSPARVERFKSFLDPAEVAALAEEYRDVLSESLREDLEASGLL